MTPTASLEPDVQLMLRVRQGCESSFAQLLERHRTPVVRFLFRMVQDRAVAEELAQEAFLRVYRFRATYEPTARFSTWLYRIATRLALNWLRDGKHERGQWRLDDAPAGESPWEAADSGPTPEDRMVNDVRLQQVRAAIQTLPPKQRAAVIMHKYEELDYATIAAALACSESAVKSILFRAYQRLRARLAHLEASAERGKSL